MANESIELMSEGLKAWNRGEGEGNEGAAEEGVFSFYLGEMRARAWLAAYPEQEGSDLATTLAMIHEVGNNPINGWAYGDPEGLAAIINRMVAHDRANPNLQIPYGVMEEVRGEYESLRDQLLEQADEIRAERAATGAEVR
ncbi:hypothetical protein Rumeso_02077 [Rubellimicrobium mesophilum DSM 19309]|uniref:Uncharacterized protein n=1 Tax=Rubellimicrobium mesophilum DSM 19309 TaxID=442562 RepID=A0A017HRC7_9RHOB|nr:hypothetical protein [Rubellimicrobium mesophilum]EYD76319.1 hypothetical protein Rumeso_02077 [Rubellimicrobium mesophilum DSM 19309]